MWATRIKTGEGDRENFRRGKGQGGGTGATRASLGRLQVHHHLDHRRLQELLAARSCVDLALGVVVPVIRITVPVQLEVDLYELAYS